MHWSSAMGVSTGSAVSVVQTVSSGAAAATAYEVREAYGGLDAEVAQAVLARAGKLAIATPQDLKHYITTHNIEEALNSVLNEVVKEQPAAPLTAMAQMLPPPAHSTPTLPAGTNDEMEALRRTWITMRSMEEGTPVY